MSGLFYAVDPFFLEVMKIFLVVFFLYGQLIRIDDLHLLQFLTKPALIMHIICFFSFGYLEKNPLLSLKRDNRNSSDKAMLTRAYKGAHAIAHFLG
jgi:hypothetical protein